MMANVQDMQVEVNAELERMYEIVCRENIALHAQIERFNALLPDYLESYADYQEHYTSALRLGDAPETFLDWYNGANRASSPYVQEPVQP